MVIKNIGCCQNQKRQVKCIPIGINYNSQQFNKLMNRDRRVTNQ